MNKRERTQHAPLQESDANKPQSFNEREQDKTTATEPQAPPSPNNSSIITTSVPTNPSSQIINRPDDQSNPNTSQMNTTPQVRTTVNQGLEVTEPHPPSTMEMNFLNSFAQFMTQYAMNGAGFKMDSITDALKQETKNLGISVHPKVVTKTYDDVVAYNRAGTNMKGVFNPTLHVDLIKAPARLLEFNIIYGAMYNADQIKPQNIGTELEEKNTATVAILEPTQTLMGNKSIAQVRIVLNQDFFNSTIIKSVKGLPMYDSELTFSRDTYQVSEFNMRRYAMAIIAMGIREASKIQVVTSGGGRTTDNDGTKTIAGLSQNLIYIINRQHILPAAPHPSLLAFVDTRPYVKNAIRTILDSIGYRFGKQSTHTLNTSGVVNVSEYAINTDTIGAQLANIDLNWFQDQYRRDEVLHMLRCYTLPNYVVKLAKFEDTAYSIPRIFNKEYLHGELLMNAQFVQTQQYSGKLAYEFLLATGALIESDMAAVNTKIAASDVAGQYQQTVLQHLSPIETLQCIVHPVVPPRDRPELSTLSPNTFDASIMLDMLMYILFVNFFPSVAFFNRHVLANAIYTILRKVYGGVEWTNFKNNNGLLSGSPGFGIRITWQHMLAGQIPTIFQDDPIIRAPKIERIRQLLRPLWLDVPDDRAMAANFPRVQAFPTHPIPCMPAELDTGDLFERIDEISVFMTQFQQDALAAMNQSKTFVSQVSTLVSFYIERARIAANAYHRTISPVLQTMANFPEHYRPPCNADMSAPTPPTLSISSDMADPPKMSVYTDNYTASSSSNVIRIQAVMGLLLIFDFKQVGWPRSTTKGNDQIDTEVDALIQPPVSDKLKASHERALAILGLNAAIGSIADFFDTTFVSRARLELRTFLPVTQNAANWGVMMKSSMKMLSSTQPWIATTLGLSNDPTTYKFFNGEEENGNFRFTNPVFRALNVYKIGVPSDYALANTRVNVISDRQRVKNEIIYDAFSPSAVHSPLTKGILIAKHAQYPLDPNAMYPLRNRYMPQDAYIPFDENFHIGVRTEFNNTSYIYLRMGDTIYDNDEEVPMLAFALTTYSTLTDAAKSLLLRLVHFGRIILYVPYVWANIERLEPTTVQLANESVNSIKLILEAMPNQIISMTLPLYDFGKYPRLQLIPHVPRYLWFLTPVIRSNVLSGMISEGTDIIPSSSFNTNNYFFGSGRLMPDGTYVTSSTNRPITPLVPLMSATVPHLVETSLKNIMTGDIVSSE